MAEQDDKIDFTGVLERSYVLGSQRVLLFGVGYSGDIETGDWITIEVAGGESTVKVVNLAWGSAFHAKTPPLTLVVEGLLDHAPEPGAKAVRVPAPS
ncbi:MAG: hypothetical protein AAGF12_17325 [Myxococcota bacterium]